MKRIRFLIMDVDGTLTDGKIYMNDNGECCKAFNIKDGLGIHDILPQLNIKPIIMTGRFSKILERRCAELGIKDIYQGINNKVAKIEEIIENKADVAYIGDDLNDLQCMEAVKAAGGLIGCPADAVQEVIDIADFIAKNNGGDGAVREFIEWLAKRQI